MILPHNNLSYLLKELVIVPKPIHHNDQLTIIMEPTSPQSLSLQFDRVSGELLATMTPQAGVPVVNMILLKQALTDGGFNKLHIDEAALGDFVAKATSAIAPYSQVIGQRRDGEFLLEVADDLMSACLTLVPPQ